MALVSDGSRVCGRNRDALGAIDADTVLINRFEPFIFCGGVDLAAGDSWTSADGGYEWQWRIEDGAWADPGATGEIGFSGQTVLVDTTIVSNANKRTNQTAASTASLVEIENGFASAPPAVPLTGEVSSESQIALSAAGAIPGAKYQMRLHCFDAGGLSTIEYAAKIIIPIFPTNYASHPKQKLRR